MAARFRNPLFLTYSSAAMSAATSPATGRRHPAAASSATGRWGQVAWKGWGGGSVKNGRLPALLSLWAARQCPQDSSKPTMGSLAMMSFSFLPCHLGIQTKEHDGMLWHAVQPCHRHSRAGHRSLAGG